MKFMKGLGTLGKWLIALCLGAMVLMTLIITRSPRSFRYRTIIQSYDSTPALFFQDVNVN